MFVELVYDKRNFDGLPGAKDIILGELTKRVATVPTFMATLTPLVLLPAFIAMLLAVTRTICCGARTTALTTGSGN